ncbi:Mif2/CENP-C like-domain-containing protein [Amylostereum chailletii]|nr:Mif2/CENP-C like-domain-containing protein [Amylostereum chailletii]
MTVTEALRISAAGISGRSHVLSERALIRGNVDWRRALNPTLAHRCVADPFPMPTSARKSSLGSRKPKGHIPFRADDLARGKKTGFAVGYVDHKSDEFEPFDRVLSQADARTPPRARKTNGKANGRRKSVVTLPDDDDEYGEMSMELDDDMPSPNMYYNSSRMAAPNSANRVGSSSRPVPRSSDVDYDSLPSPPRKSLGSLSRRSSNVNGYSAGPSHLSTSTVIPAQDDDVPFDDGGGDYGDEYGYGDEEEDPNTSHAPPSRRASFTQMAHDDEEMEEDEEDAEDRVRHSKAKGKGKATSRDLDEEEEEVDDREHPDGLRRGARTRYKPLAWWRNEKVVYGRRETGTSFVPVIKEVVRVREEPHLPLGKAGKRKRSKAPRSQSHANDDPSAVYNPEEGWDEQTPLTGVVLDWHTGEEVQRRLAFPSSRVQPRPAANNEFYFQKIFGDGEFIAAGQLRIPPNGHKPSKMTKDNTYVFFVIEGAVTFKVHESSYILCTGASILVPRGNNYYIENIGDRDARLFFAQARRVSADEEAMPDVHPASEAPPDEPPPSRPSSAGPGRKASSEKTAPPPKKRGASSKA